MTPPTLGLDIFIKHTHLQTRVYIRQLSMASQGCCTNMAGSHPREFFCSVDLSCKCVCFYFYHCALSDLHHIMLDVIPIVTV